MAKGKKYRRITKGEITFLSLCQAGKNLLPTLYKAMDSEEVVLKTCLLKATPAQVDAGELTALVYVPNKPDAEDDFADAEVIKELAYSFMKNGGKLDVHHDNVPLTREQAYPAETFLVQKADPRFVGATDVHGEAVDATGAWAVVIKLMDPKLRELYKSGAWDGVSMGGSAAREPADVNKSTESEDNMALSDEDLKKIAEISAQAATAVVTKALATQAETKAAEKKLDRTSPKAVRAHLASLEKARLEREADENVDWDDPESVRVYAEGLEKAEQDAKERRENERASRAPLSDSKDTDSFPEGTSELIKAGAALGTRMANAMNKARGYAVETK